VSRSIILALTFVFLLSCPLIINSKAEEYYYLEDSLEEGYYYPIELLDSEYEMEYTITISSNVDILILTYEEYIDCCEEEVSETLSSNDKRNSLSTDEHVFETTENENRLILIIENADVVPNGAEPNGKVTFELIGEIKMTYSFQFLGFLSGLLFIPIILFTSFITLSNKFSIDKILSWDNQKFKTFLLKYSNFIENNESKFYSKYPTLTLLMSINILAFMIAVIFGTSPEGATINQGLNMGATSFYEVFQGDFFSLIASNFMHWDWQHLLFNMLSFFFLGRYVEEELGSIRFFWFAMFTGLCSSIIGLLDLSISGGASGIGFALIGIIFSQIVIAKLTKIDSICRFPDMSYYWYVFIGNILLIPFISQDGIAVFGHLGGFFGGFGVGYYLFRSGRPGTNVETISEEKLSKMIDIEDDKKVIVENFEQLPLGGSYVYVIGKVGYLTLDNFLYISYQDKQFRLEKWLPPEEE
jgi:membrane associated rhomboid family serine protease